jgi:hypothetical protein
VLVFAFLVLLVVLVLLVSFLLLLLLLLVVVVVVLVSMLFYFFVCWCAAGAVGEDGRLCVCRCFFAASFAFRISTYLYKIWSSFSLLSSSSLSLSALYYVDGGGGLTAAYLPLSRVLGLGVLRVLIRGSG